MPSDRELSRRRLLALSVAASVSAVAGLAPDAAEAAEQHPQVPRRVLGKTKQSIPILLLGGGAGFKGGFDSRISVALRHGANYIDTARSYAGGTSEPHAAQTLHKLGARDKTWITSKSGKWSARSFARDVDFSLAELKTTWVDLYFLHALDELEPLDDKALIGAVEQLKKAGKIRFFGFSCHGGNVAELLHAAAQRSFVDAVMFRYSFRDYGDKELNRAIDAAHRAGVGLIAMKTQGSEAGLEEAWRKFEKAGKWNKYQAVLKAVWADQRISAAVSHMTTLEQLRQNIAAAVDRRELGALEWDAVRRYADATRAYACNGCDHLCSSALGAPARVGDTLRYLMYHDSYGDQEQARALFRALPEQARRLDGVDWSAANRACPRGVDVALHMKRALRVLA